MSVTILIVEKIGSIKELTLKSYNELELYKKAGFKTQDNFKCHAQWNIEKLNNKNYYISVFGKKNGRANQENKYEFPPPIDNLLLFGNCIIVNKDKNGNIDSLSEKEWDSIYEYLFDGFDDIDKDSDNDDDYDDEEDDIPKTKNGYIKDGFVVDDDEVEEEDEEEDDEEEDDEEDEEIIKSKSKKSNKISKDKSKNKKNVDNIFIKLTETQENYLDCTSELCEEEYI